MQITKYYLIKDRKVVFMLQKLVYFEGLSIKFMYSCIVGIVLHHGFLKIILGKNYVLVPLLNYLKILQLFLLKLSLKEFCFLFSGNNIQPGRRSGVGNNDLFPTQVKIRLVHWTKLVLDGREKNEPQ